MDVMVHGNIHLDSRVHFCIKGLKFNGSSQNIKFESKKILILSRYLKLQRYFQRPGHYSHCLSWVHLFEFFFTRHYPFVPTQEYLWLTHEFRCQLSSQVTQGFSFSQRHAEVACFFSPNKVHSCPYGHLEATHLPSLPRTLSSPHGNLETSYLLSLFRTYFGSQRHLKASI